VLVLDQHPSAQTAATIRKTLSRLGEHLEDAGVDVQHTSDDLPDLASAHESYATMLATITSRGVPGAAPITAHDWMELVDVQMRLARQWHSLFSGFDVVLAPAFGTAAFPHEDGADWSARTLLIDGEQTPYGQQLAWPGVATFPGLPATVAPVGQTPEGLPLGIQIIGDLFADHKTLAFAALLEREGLARFIRPS
jgi:amidase